MTSIPDSLDEDDAARVESIMDAHGYEELTGTQQQALAEGGLEPQNTLLIAETGNGKTLVAETVLKKTLDEGGEAAYLVPSYQLTKGKKNEIEEWIGDEYSVGTGTGGLRYDDVPVMTFESFFQAVMRNIGEIRSFDRVIFDDFHEIYSYHRGPGIEKAITACLDSDITMFSMSATVGNPEELAEWLDATLIQSDSDRSIPVDERPIEDAVNKSRGEHIAGIVDEREDKAPFIVFNNRRDWAETRAEDIADTGLFRDANSRDFHGEIDAALSAEMTGKYETLADLMERGVAFHHSGLEAAVRDIIVDAVQSGDIPCVSATPGLAYGFDAPIQSVIVADLKRYGDWIGVYEYVQWIGRAGRPGYGYETGYAFPIYKDEQAYDYFQFDTPTKEKRLEPVETHIESESEFRWLLLELIDFGWDTPEEIEAFLQNSLFWQQYTSAGAWGRTHGSANEELERRLRQTVAWLERNDLILERRTSNRFETTSFGEAAIEFNYETWIPTELEAITQLSARLPNVLDDPLKLVDLLARQVDRVELRRTPTDDRFESRLHNRGLRSDEASKTAALLCWHWAEGDSLDDLEDRFDTDMSGVPSTGRDAANLLEATGHLINAHETMVHPDWYDTLIGQLRYGVPAEDLFLAEQVDQLGRGRLDTLRGRINQLDVTDTGEPLPDQLQTIYEEGSRGQLEDVLKDTYGIGSKIAERLADIVEEWDADQQVTSPPFESPDGDSQSEDSEGFTQASNLDDFR